MFDITSTQLEALRARYPRGARVELVSMDDPYNRTLFPGEKGTVIFIDDIGTIQVNWDNGSSLGVAYGEDTCRLLSEQRDE